jgi:hypothetical protein
VRVFLSHASEDSHFTIRLADALSKQNVPFWFSKQHIRGGQQWHDEIGAALRKCDWFAVVLTPSSVRSVWVKRELLYALNDVRLRNRIIPILRKKCRHDDLSWTLASFQMIDFTGEFDQGCSNLLRIWNLPDKT